MKTARCVRSKSETARSLRSPPKKCGMIGSDELLRPAEAKISLPLSISFAVGVGAGHSQTIRDPPLRRHLAGMINGRAAVGANDAAALYVVEPPLRWVR